MTVVIHASFAVDWLVTEDFDRLDDALSSPSTDDLHAPVIFWHETASALRNMTFRGRITRVFRNQAFVRLAGLNIALDGSASILRVVETSDRFSLTVYAAAYLELAMRTDSDLATTDGGLIAAAQQAGLRVLAR